MKVPNLKNTKQILQIYLFKIVKLNNKSINQYKYLKS